MRTHLAFFVTLSAGLAAVTAQESPRPAEKPPATTTTPTLEELARDVEAAHHPDGPVSPIEAFRCSLELRLTDRTAENAGQVGLDVAFLLWREEGRKKARPLIRYTVRTGEQPIERGRDRNGPWQLQRGAPVGLDSGQFDTDLEQCNRHTNLARQMLRFLSPGEVLRDMKDAVVTRTEFRIDRATRVPCWTIRGLSTRFPLLRSAGEDATVQLEVHVDAASHRLIGVDAAPIVDGKPVAAQGERILLEELRARDGVLVPHRLVHLFVDERGVPRPQTVASFTKLELRPELGPADFDRQR
ncbi:MAG: hypothetical protein H6835_18975 [Planctomycetes bacterium]|nr:hypothetical protein [Planctomycetota bacterium]